MSRIIAALTALVLTAACQSPGVPGIVPNPPVSADNLNGYWKIGTGPEPPAGGVSGCGSTSGDGVRLTQQGQTLTGEVMHCTGPCYVKGQVSGSNTSGTVRLSGTLAEPIPDRPSEATTFELTFDPTTKHLVGTRNGEPVWLVPHVADETNACPH